jgi:hypothetical protein
LLLFRDWRKVRKEDQEQAAIKYDLWSDHHLQHHQGHLHHSGHHNHPSGDLRSKRLAICRGPDDYLDLASFWQRRIPNILYEITLDPCETPGNLLDHVPSLPFNR